MKLAAAVRRWSEDQTAAYAGASVGLRVNENTYIGLGIKSSYRKTCASWLLVNALLPSHRHEQQQR